MTAGAVAIVPMTIEHITVLMQYEQAMFGTEAWPASAYRAELADTDHRCYLVAEGHSTTANPRAVAGAELIGWAGVRVIADSADVLTVGVVPAARRRGIAHRLLVALLSEARRRGATEAFLEVRQDNHAAQALYERAGFAQVGLRPGYYEGGRVAAVVMRRAL